MALTWEKLESSGLDTETLRAKVPGGWLVLVSSGQAGVPQKAPVTFRQRLFQSLFLWLVIGLLFLLLFNVFTTQHSREPEVVFSDFWAAVERGDVQEVTIRGQNIEGRYQNGSRFRTFAPGDPNLVATLRGKRIRIAAKPEEESPWYVLLLVQWFPLVLVLLVLRIWLRRLSIGRLAVAFYPDPTHNWDGSSLQATPSTSAGQTHARVGPQGIMTAKEIDTLASRGDVESLVTALRSPDVFIRGRAVIEFGTLKDARAVDPLIEVLRTDDDWGIRENAVKALASIKDARAVGPLIAALKDPHKDVRLNAVLALGGIGDKQAIRPLEELAKRDSYVAKEAHWALKELMAK
ncbi:MAG: ATP-dependent metallopeptidase FtsH/Yme1/Tma family protein [Deltaproteobacteria bacterium]|nr:ATP-dependent metallopeptidase FtsH/Yme1/Tma family protein [Deltaproteobacteria bacterium]